MSEQALSVNATRKLVQGFVQYICLCQSPRDTEHVGEEGKQRGAMKLIV